MNQVLTRRQTGSRSAELDLCITRWAERAEIHWGDETAPVNAGVRGRSYTPTDGTPVAMAIGGTRQKLSMIATVTNPGKTRWMIIDELFDAAKLVEFLQARIKDAGRKVFLILNSLRVHPSKLVKAWMAEHQDEIELFYLPSDRPHLNPEERLNADLKQEMGKRVPVRTKAGLRARLQRSTWRCWSKTLRA